MERTAAETGYIITREESERINILKTWMAIMVVFIHAYDSSFSFRGEEVVFATAPWVEWTKYLLSRVISTCAVPGYFFLSSMFLFRREQRWSANIRKKLRTLLIPYLLLNSVWIGIYFMAQHIGFLSRYFSDPNNFVSGWSLLDWLGAYTIFSQEGAPFDGPLWFMRDLLVLNIMAPGIKWLIDKVPKCMLIVLTALALFSQTVYPLLRQFAFVSFCLGYYAVKYDLHFSDIDKLSPLPLTAVYLASIALACAMRGSRFYFLPDALAALTGFLFFARCTTRITSPVWRSRLLWASGFGTPVYLFHGRSLSIMRKLVSKFLPKMPVFNALEYFGSVFAIIVLCSALAAVMRRFTPRLYGILTGGR